MGNNITFHKLISYLFEQLYSYYHVVLKSATSRKALHMHMNVLVLLLMKDR